MFERIKMEADDNMESLSANKYPGRVIVMGRDESGMFAVQIYCIMGRSPNSQNRVFCTDGGRLFTKPADPTKVQDTSLTIYNAMRECRPYYIVSNGHQTDSVHTSFELNGPSMSLPTALNGQEYEPDEPNYTPRITGLCSLNGRIPTFKFGILRKSPWDVACERVFHSYERLLLGFGHCVTTYSGDGNPLPSFTGDPRIVPLFGDMDDIRARYWSALNHCNRVSLAVKFIRLSSGESTIKVVNRFSQVSA